MYELWVWGGKRLYEREKFYEIIDLKKVIIKFYLLRLVLLNNEKGIILPMLFKLVIKLKIRSDRS